MKQYERGDGKTADWIRNGKEIKGNEYPEVVPLTISLTLTIPIYLTLGHVTFLVWIITHC